jgi:signal transduction histidine kinase
MRKNTWKYIQMGLKNKEHIAQKKAEEEKIKSEEANAFNKAFADKTYSVAKKVIENVEKVSNYDYEKLFDRVNQAFEDKKSDDKPKAPPRPSEKASSPKESHGNKINQDFKASIKKEIQSIVSDVSKSVDVKKEMKAISKNLNKSLDFKINLSKNTDEMDLSNEKSSIDEVGPLNKENPIDEISIEDKSFTLETELGNKEIQQTTLDMKKETPKEAVEIKESIIKSEDLNINKDIFESETFKEKTIKDKVSEPIVSDPDKNKAYYKKRRREKFAKKMNVELNDSLLIQQKRSLTRLFKFSLAFKLSVVFILLMIVTIVTLSVAFYFGIDYVVELKEAGRLQDISLFKNVLMILLIIFNFVAILLCVSIGSKASRELVRPLDEMTKIVKQINGEAMDRRLNVKGMHDELKELALTFNEMLDRIEHAYETQNRFTSDASHELRTPIAVIQGYINMLDRWGKADGAVLDESIDAIKSESNNMKQLTEKLLLLAKADKGILEMKFETFSLHELISEISKETTMIDSNHEISNEINDVNTIVADRPSLKQAIRIFVDNSVKYTPDGGKISINAYCRKKNIYIEISDNGIGISQDDMKHIFNRFYRADPSRTKASGGHGLGLSIAKWIVKEHQGEIEIKSELNKGTVVTIILTSQVK